MQTNDTIVIKKAFNGVIVQRAIEGEVINEEDTLVFTNLDNLSAWLKTHFLIKEK